MACQNRGLPLSPKERSPVTRIYRDTRFNPEKGPFHDFVGGMLTGKAPTGEVYIHLSAENCFAAAGFYMPPPPFLSAARERIAAKPEDFLAVVAALRRKKLELVDEWKLRRMPRGFETFATSPAAEYLKLNCYVVRRWLNRAEMVDPRLAATVTKFISAAWPLLDWGWRAQ